MDKYKELSKQLRYCGDEGKCQSCEFYRETEPCSQNLLGEAAGAIEELLKAQDQMGDDIAMMNEELLKHEWIPCDKGEPDEDMECWVTGKDTYALYRGNFTKRYGERRDKGFITSGGFMWWNTALAWMPIYEPEPYKGEEE